MKRWHYRCLGGMAGIVGGGILVLGLTSCDSGPIADAAAGMRDRAGFDQARQQLLDRHAPQSVALGKPLSAKLDIMHDDTNGVTCWSRREFMETLTCLPDWMLTPAQRKPVTDKCLVKDVGDSEACRKAFADLTGIAQ